MDVGTLASLLTAGGTLVLGVATFASTRSANRASRIAERSLLANLRPVLVNAQVGDPRQKVGFADEHWVHLEGPRAAFDVSDPEDDAPAIYLAFSVRNVGSGIGIIQGWFATPQRLVSVDGHPAVEGFRAQTRSLYVPPGGVGFWQGALRDPAEPLYAELAKAAVNRTPITIDLLYTDMNGGQQTITRMSVLPGRPDPETNQDTWFATIGKHWLLSEEGLVPATAGSTEPASGVTLAQVRRWALALPRTQEHLIREYVKFRVGRIVYATVSPAETILGFGFPKDERAAMIAAEPDRFLLERLSDQRYHWIDARMAALSPAEAREFIIDAWRMVVPKRVAAEFAASGAAEAPR